jgi:hypothetical protein
MSDKLREFIRTGKIKGHTPGLVKAPCDDPSRHGEVVFLMPRSMPVGIWVELEYQGVGVHTEVIERVAGSTS